MNFKNPWGKNGTFFPKYIQKTQDHWFNDGPSIDTSERDAALTSPTGGIERTKVDFETALKNKTVEDRVRAIVAVFLDGDYIKASTIYDLTNITRTAVSGEKSHCAGARDLISHISKITKDGDYFTISMVDEEDHMSTISITSDLVNINLFLEVEEGATVEVVDNVDNLILKFDDINGGILSQYLTPELPNATLDENILTVLLIPILLVPKQT